MREKFNFSESSNSYIGEIELKNRFIEIEIKLEEDQFNWSEIDKFILKLDSSNFNKLETIATELLLGFIKLVPFGLEEPYDNYKFQLEAISYYGKVNNLIFGKPVDGYELIFKIYHSDCVECYDPYGNYIVNVTHELITGVRREQV